MQGLTLAQEYFDTFGEPMLKSKFKNDHVLIAAGLVGMGSECFECDDTLSRDHDWGPGFCLWLDKDGVEKIGAKLQKEYDALPTLYKGFRRNTSMWGGNRVGVMEIAQFYTDFIGRKSAPRESLEWFSIPESNLAACTNGKVFRDPLGKFTAIRKEIGQYFPEDVRLKKMAGRLMTAGQSGQYHYQRCLQRHDAYGTWWALIRFASDILAVIYLLNFRYCPFFKWRQQIAKALPLLGSQITGLLDRLVTTGDHDQRNGIIEEICILVGSELNRQTLSGACSTSLLVHGCDVQKRIQDDVIRGIDIWYSGIPE